MLLLENWHYNCRATTYRAKPVVQRDENDIFIQNKIGLIYRSVQKHKSSSVNEH